MNPLPLLSRTRNQPASPGGIVLVPRIIFFALVLIHSNSLGQKKYYEYNNPDAMKVGKDVIARLTADEWSVSDVRWLIRKDTFDYSGRASLKLRNNGTYKSGSLEGTWQIKYNRYLVLTDTNRIQSDEGISGTFGITSFKDSMMVLQKIHTSSRDMSKTITLVKYQGDHHATSAATGRTQEEIRKIYGEWRKPAQRRNLLAPALIDSLRFLSREELGLLGYRDFNDTLFIDTPDSLYRIRLERYNALKKVKIFYENEAVVDLDAFRRFTLHENQIPLVDSLAMKYIRQHRDDYAPQKEIILSNYFRQYVGYFDVNGDAIVLLNAFCQYKNSWQKSLIQVGLGGVCNFNISINLTKKEAFSFHVNDF